MEYYLQLIINGLVVGSIYSLVALGFVIIFKATKVVNFAQGELVMVGAYVCFALTVQFQLPFLASFLLTLAFSIVLATAVERLILRPLIGEPIISVIMVTIGLSVVLRGVTLWIFGAEPRSFPAAAVGGKVEIAGLNIEAVYLWSTGVAVIGMAAFAAFFKYSRLGLAMRATAFNQQVAQSLGVSIQKIFVVSWAISALVSGVAGVVVGMVNGISPGLTLFGIKVFPAVILGGLDSILGAALGGIIIGVLENLSDGVLKSLFNLQGLKEVAPFVFLVIILMVKPYGLFGTKDIERV